MNDIFASENRAQTINDLAQRFIDALHKLEHDAELDSIVELFSDDATVVNAALELIDEARCGPEGARAFWDDYRKLFEDAHSEFHQVTVADQAAGLFWTTRGHIKNGGPFEYQGASLLVFDQDQKITAFRGYYDTRKLTLNELAQ